MVTGVVSVKAGKVCPLRTGTIASPCPNEPGVVRGDQQRSTGPGNAWADAPVSQAKPARTIGLRRRRSLVSTAFLGWWRWNRDSSSRPNLRTLGLARTASTHPMSQFGIGEVDDESLLANGGASARRRVRPGFSAQDDARQRSCRWVGHSVSKAQPPPGVPPP